MTTKTITLEVNSITKQLADEEMESINEELNKYKQEPANNTLEQYLCDVIKQMAIHRREALSVTEVDTSDL